MKFKPTLSRMMLTAALVGTSLLGAASFVPAQTIGGSTKLLAPDAKNQKEKDRLAARSESRHPQIRRYKSDGKIGESSTGYLEAVKKDYLSDDALKQLIDDENKDRKALYTILADEDGIDVGLVAKRAAKRNIGQALAGEYVKQDGTWKKK
jgi:uncharacterized protein YdbL (DUF1318 family)